ncbi:MAG: hypothetical protein AAF125_13845 [Chloroflexota bacterium]
MSSSSNQNPKKPAITVRVTQKPPATAKPKPKSEDEVTITREDGRIVQHWRGQRGWTRVVEID